MLGLHDPVVAVPVSYLVTALVASGARFVVSKEPPSLRKLIETLIASLALVIASYPYLEEQGLGNGLTNLVVATGAFMAPDVLETVLKLWKQVKADPLAVVRELLNYFKPKGGSP